MNTNELQSSMQTWNATSTSPREHPIPSMKTAIALQTTDQQRCRHRTNFTIQTKKASFTRQTRDKKQCIPRIQLTSLEFAGGQVATTQIGNVDHSNSTTSLRLHDLHPWCNAQRVRNYDPSKTKSKWYSAKLPMPPSLMNHECGA